jgi:hypothetical protein
VSTFSNNIHQVNSQSKDLSLYQNKQRQVKNIQKYLTENILNFYNMTSKLIIVNVTASIYGLKQLNRVTAHTVKCLESESEYY